MTLNESVLYTKCEIAKRCKAIIMTKSTSFEEQFLLWRVCVKKQNEEVLREKINLNKLLWMLKNYKSRLQVSCLMQ